MPGWLSLLKCLPFARVMIPSPTLGVGQSPCSAGRPPLPLSTTPPAYAHSLWKINSLLKNKVTKVNPLYGNINNLVLMKNKEESLLERVASFCIFAKLFNVWLTLKTARFFTVSVFSLWWHIFLVDTWRKFNLTQIWEKTGGFINIFWCLWLCFDITIPKLSKC